MNWEEGKKVTGQHRYQKFTSTADFVVGWKHVRSVSFWREKLWSHKSSERILPWMILIVKMRPFYLFPSSVFLTVTLSISHLEYFFSLWKRCRSSRKPIFLWWIDYFLFQSDFSSCLDLTGGFLWQYNQPTLYSPYIDRPAAFFTLPLNNANPAEKKKDFCICRMAEWALELVIFSSI